MLKSEVIKLINLDESKMKKLVLMRYVIKVDQACPMPYDEQCLAFIQSIKSLPESFSNVSFYYEMSDRKVTHLQHQQITIYIDGAYYYHFDLDDDLDLFFVVLRLFHYFEAHVEAYEELTTESLLPQVLERYQKVNKK